MPIIEVLDDKVRRKYHNQAVYIIDGEERVHMAHRPDKDLRTFSDKLIT